jgi:selenocysteine-specific elongation factor
VPLTVGTAGHIDHGKTWLVRALTGKDTDRLPEERRRGISIELGYAPLELPGGRRLSLVDVPGHERFVRTMVAGATGIDLFLLVVDAAEGARPQTHEHLAVLRLLGVTTGVVAVTKADAVDEETLELAVEEARELVPEAEVVAVSAKTGEGLGELRAALARAATVADRSRGQASGSIGRGDELRVEPGGLGVRVRSVQVHDREVERAESGQRVAVSLPGVERRALRRGDALVSSGDFPASFRLDVLLEPLADVPAAVTVHHGTAAVAARVARAGERYAQLRLAERVVAARGDRLVLRARTTVAGATVLDPAPPRHRDEARFERLERGEVLIHAPVRGDDGEWQFSQEWLDELRAELEARLAVADPLDPGVPAPTEPWAREVIPLLGLERRGAKLYRPGAAPALGERAEAAARLERELAAAGFEPVKVDEPDLALFLEREGKLVRVGDGLAVGAEAYERARTLVVEEAAREGRIALARFRDLAGISRRPAQLLLERMDADGLTRRVGDERVLRRQGGAGQRRSDGG